MTQARKTATKAKDGLVEGVSLDQIRDVPTDEEHKAKAAQEKKNYDLSDAVKVQTTSGGNMYDPEGDQWITGRLNLAANTDWLKRQIAAGKIELVK
ncbi:MULTISPECIES: hypothetical protein [Oligella]|uniref:Uncharacterized protein n=1 Tax=Oligella urethralis TaxID=90245 RepID=A0A2X1UUE2_9BURK|nr:MULTISPECIES: hypothetical protein [Oligella]OFV49703.1 hypothetical protein HMPREF3179_03590 [Oligella sp. HMSC09E12]SPY08031.1 Uncharacterised protein [Oligella urethralis]